MKMTCMEDLLAAAARTGTMPRVAVAASAQDVALLAALDAHARGIAEPVLVGDLEETRRIAGRAGVDISALESHHVPDKAGAVQHALALFRAGDVSMLMKGNVNTDVLLKGVLNKETGVPPAGILSHVAVFCLPGEPRLRLLTDAGVNIAPNLQRKAEIVRNALHVARSLGLERPRAAMLAATEKVMYPAMPATLDAQMVARMSAEGAFGDAVVSGPMALDLAVSPAAVARKGFEDPVAGNADVLVAPDIESGNVLYKTLTTLLDLPVAGIVAGSRIPLIVPSRGDSDRSKLYALALAAYMTRKECTG